MELPFERGLTEHLGRTCVRFDGSSVKTVADVELLDGAVELDAAVGPERAFHGVVWRLQDDENFESFFVRPHQVGNDDAVQYTPVCNGSSAWQLYHGAGFWAPIAFPTDEWFTIRVLFTGEVAETYVADLDAPALVSRLRREPAAGRVGLLVGGEGYHVARFEVDPEARSSRAVPKEPVVTGAVPAWWVSDPFAEGSLPEPSGLGWARLESEPSGLVNLARATAIRDGRNTVYACATVRSEHAQTKDVEFGFSDRALALLNGRRLFHGDDTYRSRDYRFLGSIGYWDTLVLQLEEGDNELSFAVSEDFGGWGVQARFADREGISFPDQSPIRTT